MEADCSKGRDVDAVVGGPDVTRTAAARLAPSHVPTSNAITFAVVFVQFEAAGNFGALFHLNCLKRPMLETMETA